MAFPEDPLTVNDFETAPTRPATIRKWFEAVGIQITQKTWEKPPADTSEAVELPKEIHVD